MFPMLLTIPRCLLYGSRAFLYILTTNRISGARFAPLIDMLIRPSDPKYLRCTTSILVSCDQGTVARDAPAKCDSIRAEALHTGSPIVNFLRVLSSHSSQPPPFHDFDSSP